MEIKEYFLQDSDLLFVFVDARVFGAVCMVSCCCIDGTGCSQYVAISQMLCLQSLPLKQTFCTLIAFYISARI